MAERVRKVIGCTEQLSVKRFFDPSTRSMDASGPKKIREEIVAVNIGAS